MPDLHSPQFLGGVQLDAFEFPVVLPRLPDYHQILVFVYLQEALAALGSLCPLQAVLLEVVDDNLTVFLDFPHVSPVVAEIERSSLHLRDDCISKC